ncbi:MAG: carbonic anhydrase [Nostoc sp.]
MLANCCILFSGHLSNGLGHEKCGAVQAAIANKPLPGRINSVVDPILPVVASVKNQPGDIIDNVVIANVKYQVQKLQERSPILTQLIQQGKLKIVGGRYDLHSGKVNIIT